MDVKAYDRWLKDAEAWVVEDDWNPDEYLIWKNRLEGAKASLDQTFLSIDQTLLDGCLQMAKKHRATVMKARPQGDDGVVNCVVISKLFVRPVIAYHFYQRNTFEETPEKSLVERVQFHLSDLGIRMLDIDVAMMLQYAADEVPITEAVEKQLREYVQMIRLTESVGNVYDANELRKYTPLLVTGLQQTRVFGGPMDRSKLDQILNHINQRVIDEYQRPLPEPTLENIKRAFSDDDKVELWLKRCAEPMVRNTRGDNHAATALEVLIDTELEGLLEVAVKLEEQECSWEATIGPTVKALRRLGRITSGKEMDNPTEQ